MIVSHGRHRRSIWVRRALTARDITERVELERMAKHYQAVIQSSFDAVITESLDGIVTTWNPAAQNIFEYKSEEIVGKSLRLLIPQELLREEEIILSKVGEGKTVHPFDTVRCTKSGTRVAVSVTASPIFDADNEKIVGVSKIVRVMGDKNRAYELLDRKAPRILVVEDNTDLRELIVESINDLGADIYEAANGSEGVTKAKQLRPELVFMDMMMPGGIDGLEACRQIKADPFLVDHTKVIFVTARGHAYDREMAVRAGGDGYFLKPFSPKELRETARTILDEAKSQQGVL